MKYLLLFLIFSLSAAAWASSRVIKVGIASNFSKVSESSSNPYGNYFRNGITLALQENAAKLKAANLKIELVEFDYGDQTYAVLATAEKACKSDVAVVLGYALSDHALLAAPIHQKCKLPFLTSSASADRLGKMGPYVHQGTFDNSFQGEVLAKWAFKDLKARTASVIPIANCAYCQDLNSAFKRSFEALGGVISSEHSLLPGDDLTSAADTLKSKNPNVILIPNHEIYVAQIIKSLLEHGVNKPFLGGDGWGNTGELFFKVVGKKPFEAYSISHWINTLNTDLSRTFNANYMKEFTLAPNDTAVLSYDSANLLINRFLTTKDLSRDGVEASLQGLQKFTGVTGDFIFREGRAPKKSVVLMKTGTKDFKFLKLINPEA